MSQNNLNTQVHNRKNPPQRAKNFGVIIGVIGALLMFVPMNLGLDGMDGGFALALFGLLFLITGIVVWVMFNKQAQVLKEVLSGRDLIAAWTYQHDQWAAYTEIDYEEDRLGKIMLFRIVAGFALLIGTLFIVFDPDAGPIVALILLGVVVFIRVFIYFSTRAIYNQNREGVGEVLIHPHGIYLNGQFHGFNVAGARLDRVEIKKDDMLIIEVEYSAPGSYTRNSYIIRIPVPYGKEKEAEGVAQKLIATCSE